MKNDWLMETLKRVGAVIVDDHIVLTSGNHSEVYINKDALMPHTMEMSRVGELMATQFVGQGVEVVVGPATAGIVIAQWTAYHLSKMDNREILGVYTDKTIEGGEKRQEFKRNYDKMIQNKSVLIVEDVTATGGSIDRVVESVRALTDKLIGIGVIVNRDPKKIDEKKWSVPLVSLLDFEVASYVAKDCPMCKKAKPINVNVGHGKEFVRGEV